ncbi:MAG: histidine kinase [Devosia sp.]|nr:histidine kinase [Devosia sp.]
MRSAEKSDVGARGFFVRKSHQIQDTARAIGSGKIGKTIRLATRTQLAIVVVALSAATLFTASDAFRTLADQRERLQLVAQAMAIEIGMEGEDGAALALLRTAPKYDRLLIAQLRDPLGQIVASTHMSLVGNQSTPERVPQETVSQAVNGGAIGTLDLQITDNAAIPGIWARGAFAYGLAFAVIGFAFAGPATGAVAPRGRGRTVPIKDLISTIPFGVACWTAEGRLIVCNEQYKARLYIGDDQARPGASYQAAVRNLSVGGYVRLVSEDDNNRLIEVHREDGSCLMIDERPLVEGGFVTLVTDVTERKKADLLISSIREEQKHLARRYHEEKLKAEAASRSKTSFLAHLSHDVRTPLNHIIGFSEILANQTFGPLGDKRYKGYAENILGSGRRLLASFATILDLAELESGQKTLRVEAIDVDELLLAIGDRHRPQAMRAGLSFVVNEPSDAILYGDRFCLTRMLNNIIENAIRFTPAGGKVTLAVFAATDGVVFEVTDTGIGMSEEKLASLAQAFVFGDATFTRDANDSGLGIAIARAIAELSGGHMAIDSSPALGTTVAISLPLQPEAYASVA